MSHVTSARLGRDAAEELVAYEGRQLLGVLEVPAAGRADEREHGPGQVVGGPLDVDPGPQPARRRLALQVGRQEARDERERPRRLGAEQREQPVGLRVEDLAEHLVLLQRATGVQEPAPQELREVGGVAHVVAELREVPAELPPDGLAQQLVAPTREVPVDGRPGHARDLHDVLDGRLRHAVPGDARVRRLEEAFADGQRIGRGHDQHVRAPHTDRRRRRCHR
ncbi:MAG: hypothetical protein KatS3mg010_1913 [Acidimicrobiia bacterium]|nr:MAG: hypothetical protein KatS3mg010_1913 [Acidimicrobiia bacterium]